MAYIQQNDDLLQNGQSPDVSYPQAQVTGSGQSTDVGSGSGGVSTAGVGPGGTGMWTNVQSYLDANKGDTGSAQALSKTVGSQFGQEQDALSQNAQDYLNQAQKHVGDNNISHDQADQLIKDGSLGYDYGGNQNDAYKQNQQKVQGALTNQYSGPTSYNYGFSAPTQQYGQDLQTGGSFDQLMNKVYSQSAGKPLSAGQYALQKQLDVNNAGLDKARQDLLNQYTGLQTKRDNTVVDTTAQLGNLANQYVQNQNSLKDYLGQKANDALTQEAKAEGDATAAYNNEYNTQGTANIPTLLDFERDGLQNFAGNQSLYGQLPGDISQPGTSWANIQQMLNNPTNVHLVPVGYNPDDYLNAPTGNDTGAGDWVKQHETQWRDVAQNALNNFYSQANQKYANTGDEQKRAYNTIQDFLNSGGTKKVQGFKVRG